jgi:hypothetical protein
MAGICSQSDGFSKQDDTGEKPVPSSQPGMYLIITSKRDGLQQNSGIPPKKQEP